MSITEYNERLNEHIKVIYANKGLKTYLKKLYNDDPEELLHEVIINIYNRPPEKMYKYLDQDSFDKLVYTMCRFMSYGTVGRSYFADNKRFNKIIISKDYVENITDDYNENNNEVSVNTYTYDTEDVSINFDIISRNIYDNTDIVFEFIEEYLRTKEWYKSMIYRDYMYHKSSKNPRYIKDISIEYNIHRNVISKIVKEINEGIFEYIESKLKENDIYIPKALTEKVKKSKVEKNS